VSRSDPFKPFAGWNDTDWVKGEVEKAFAKGAGVTVKTLQRALRRIVADGYDGPFNGRDWEEMDGSRMSMKRAVAIVRRAQDADLPTARLDHPDLGSMCHGAEDCDHPEHADLGAEGPMFHPEPQGTGPQSARHLVLPSAGAYLRQCPDLRRTRSLSSGTDHPPTSPERGDRPLPSRRRRGRFSAQPGFTALPSPRRAEA
jgi:hypothetical protein